MSIAEDQQQANKKHHNNSKQQSTTTAIQSNRIHQKQHNKTELNSGEEKNNNIFGQNDK